MEPVRPTPTAPAEPDATTKAIDVHSAARPHEVVVRHTGLEVSVDFSAKVLTGTATIAVERLDPAAPLRLDTRDLDVRKVWVGTVGDVRPLASADGGWGEATFMVEPASDIFGAALVVELPEGADAVRIEYATVPEASGLQWLAPEQTAGGRTPFLYTQSQAIHAR